MSDALLPDHISIDERELPDLLAYAVRYARRIKFYDFNGIHYDPETLENLDWSAFLEKDESIFLATLLATDIHGTDDDIQASFLQLHEPRDQQELVGILQNLAENLLQKTTVLYNWFEQTAGINRSETLGQIAQEIDRALRGELGYQLHGFNDLTKKLSQSGAFPNASDWSAQISKWLTGWSRQQENVPLGFAEHPKENFADLLHFAGSALQEYYRQLHFTFTYLEELVPDLFQKSIEHKHDHAPDVALLIAFLQLFRHAQAELNRLSGRHLAYYHDKILQRVRKPGVPDQAVVAFVAAPNGNGVLVPANNLLLAGTNNEGFPSHYSTQKEVYVSKGEVAALKTLFISKNPLVNTNSSYRLVTAIYAAKVANSANGQGKDFLGVDHSWPVLGEDQFDLGTEDRQMAPSTLGFAVASSVLRLSGGERRVTVKLQFTAVSFSILISLLEDIAENIGKDAHPGDVFGSIFNQPFLLFLTGEDGWIEVKKYIIQPPEHGRLGEPVLELQFILPASTESILGYDEGIHEAGFDTSWPVLKVELSDQESQFSYSFLRDLELEQITIETEVSGLNDLKVYNDIGLLDASRPFVPFGPLPRRGSYLLMGHAELFSKRLTTLDIDLEWGELPDEPEGFTDHYANYNRGIDNDSFQFTLTALSDYAFRPTRPEEQEEFPLFSTDLSSFPPLQQKRNIHLEKADLKKLRLRPMYQLTELEEFTNAARAGYLKLELTNPKMGFGHSLYPQLFAQKMAEHARPRPFSLLTDDPLPLELPKEPYTPIINGIRVSYSAQATINLRPNQIKENPAKADDRVFRLHPFGTETVYAGDTLRTPYILPRYDADGYLYIGLTSVPNGRPISLYFSIEESIKKFNRRAISTRWEYLHGDTWHDFSPDQVIADSTVMFSTSGIVQLRCPNEMDRASSLLDKNLYWLRASASGNLAITGRCTNVVPHAIEASWVDNGDEEHLTTAPELRPTISGLASPLPGIMEVQQLGSFFGGRPAEAEVDYYVRGSERLRHKNRAITIWDYERLVLEAFPDIQQVKCIGRAGYDDISPIGRVLVVVVPKIDGTTVRPKVGYHKLEKIEHFLNKLTGPFSDFKVVNPTYEAIKVNCGIKLTEASIHQRGLVWRQLHDAIRDLVCPWLKEGTIKLGGTISKTEVISTINENPNIAFTTAFSIVQVYEPSDDYFMLRDTALPDKDPEILTPSSPLSILVPVPEHDVRFLEEDEYRSAQATAIEKMRLGDDFIISAEEEDNYDLIQAPPTRIKDQYFSIPPEWFNS